MGSAPGAAVPLPGYPDYHGPTRDRPTSGVIPRLALAAPRSLTAVARSMLDPLMGCAVQILHSRSCGNESRRRLSFLGAPSGSGDWIAS
jgi:hypothetical protein